MQDGAPVSSAGRKLERVSNGAPRGMTATRVGIFRMRGACTESGLSACFVLDKKKAGVSDDAGFFLVLWRDASEQPAGQPATISNECVNSAVFAIMIDAEQYLSCDRVIARSTVAGFRFLPVTVK
jgi:hypothetical protein